MTSFRVVMWPCRQYIKTNKLQDRTKPECINCDSKLQAVLGERLVKFSDLPKLLSEHFLPPMPVRVDFPFVVDPSNPPAREIYDIDVDAVSFIVAHSPGWCHTLNPLNAHARTHISAHLHACTHYCLHNSASLIHLRARYGRTMRSEHK